MNPISILLAIAVAAAFIFALVHSLKEFKRGCNGNCTGCGCNCTSDMQKEMMNMIKDAKSRADAAGDHRTF